MMIPEFLDVYFALHLFNDCRLSSAGKSRSTGRLRGTADECNDDAPDEGIGHPHRLGGLLHGCDDLPLETFIWNLIPLGRGETLDYLSSVQMNHLFPDWAFFLQGSYSLYI